MNKVEYCSHCENLADYQIYAHCPGEGGHGIRMEFLCVNHLPCRILATGRVRESELRKQIATPAIKYRLAEEIITKLTKELANATQKQEA